MAEPPEPRFDRVVGVERKRRLRREEFVMLVIKDRVLVQIGGQAGGRSGWMTRTVCDSQAKAAGDLHVLVADYVKQGYHPSTIDESMLPPLSEEFFDPAFNKDNLQM